MAYKVDDSGNYLQFLGLTVVSAVNQTGSEKCTTDDTSVWEKCHHILASTPDIAACYTPLPHQSYHMTTTMLENEHHTGKYKWESYVSGRLPRYQELHEALVNANIRPVFTVQEVNTGSIIYLSGSIDEESKVKILLFAGEYKLTQLLPFDWHITIAYNYAPMAREQMESISLQVSTHLRDLFIGKEFVLDIAKMCFHRDMTRFEPWDGSKYPF
jgi:hypothetical protein